MRLFPFYILIIYSKYLYLIIEKDKSQKVFSLSYVNLIGENETCLQDAVHELAVYKVSLVVNFIINVLFFFCFFYSKLTKT